MKQIAFVLALAAVACGGGGKKDATPANSEPAQEQTLTDAVTYLCAAPERTRADPKYVKGCLEKDAACPDSSGTQQALLAEHIKEKQTHPRTLAWIETPKDQKGAELQKLMADANVTSCELADIWTPTPPAP